MTSEFKDESLKFKDKTFLEQYLVGKAPLHADRLNMPSEEELDAAEADFDKMVAASKQPARHIHLWPWAVAAVAASILLLLVFNFKKETIEEKPVVAEVIEPEAIKQSEPKPVPQPVIEGKKEEKVVAEVQATTPCLQKGLHVGRPTVNKQSAPIEEPASTETQLPIHESDIEPMYAQSEEYATHYQTIQTVHLSSDVVVYVIEASDMPAVSTVPSVRELRARGLRLTDNVRQASQTTVQF